MPRYYHGGRDAIDPTKYFPEALDGEDEERVKTEKVRLSKEAFAHHPLTSPHRDNIVRIGDKLKLKRPIMFCHGRDHLGNPVQEYDDWVPGSVCLGLVGYGYFVVPPGGHVDIDPVVPEKAVKAAAPHLLTETEYQASKKPEHHEKLASIKAMIAEQDAVFLAPVAKPSKQQTNQK